MWCVSKVCHVNSVLGLCGVFPWCVMLSVLGMCDVCPWCVMLTVCWGCVVCFHGVLTVCWGCVVCFSGTLSEGMQEMMQKFAKDVYVVSLAVPSPTNILLIFFLQSPYEPYFSL